MMPGICFYSLGIESPAVDDSITCNCLFDYDGNNGSPECQHARLFEFYTFDTHENLMKENAIYREIYEAQTQGGGDFDEAGKEDA